MLTKNEMKHLHRCIELAEEALQEGDEPFGSVLVGAGNRVLAEDRNRTVSSGDPTRHPEFALARWAAQNMTPEERADATVYTSGEHCPMCAAAHGLVGLGRIVYASSSKQLVALRKRLGAAPQAVEPIPAEEVITRAVVEGPVSELAEKVLELQEKWCKRR